MRGIFNFGPSQPGLGNVAIAAALRPDTTPIRMRIGRAPLLRVDGSVRTIAVLGVTPST